MPAVEFRWKPTEEQRQLFEEWRTFAVGYLVSSREGCNIRALPGCLEEQTGEAIPLPRMGFRTINEFLYAMQERIEVRMLDGKFFVFIRECAVPENLMNIRELVLGQGKDKGCRSRMTGAIRRPTKNQSLYVRAEQLLEAVKHIITKPFNYNYLSQRPITPIPRPSTGPSRNYGPRPNMPPKFQQNSFPRNSIPQRFQQRNTGYRGQVRKPPSYSSNLPATKYTNSAPSVRGSSSSVATQRTTMASPSKMPSAIPHLNGKVSTLLSSKTTTETVNSDDSWDDDHLLKPAPKSKPPPASPAPKKEIEMARMKRYPRGLLHNTDDDDKSDDSDGFDYYSGPTRTTKPTTSSSSSTIVKSPIVNESKIIPASSTNPSVVPAAAELSQSLTPSNYTGRPATVTVPQKVSNGFHSPLKSGVTGASSTSSMNEEPSISPRISKDETKTSLQDSSASLFTAIKGITLDTYDMLAQVVPMPTRKNQIVRMAPGLLVNKFPPFLLGGSNVNMSLKAYLAGVENV